MIRVLVAEEDPFIANLLASGINTGLRARLQLPAEARFSFDHVQDGAEALSVLEKHTFELLLCDAALPIIDGLEVARRVRAVSRLRHLPVIVLGSAPALRGEALAAGADRFLEKPVPLATLVRALAEVLRVG